MSDPTKVVRGHVIWGIHEGQQEVVLYDPMSRDNPVRVMQEHDSGVGPFEEHWTAFLKTICLSGQYELTEANRVSAELDRIAHAIAQLFEEER